MNSGDSFGLEPAPPQVAGPPGPPGPPSSNIVPTIALGTVLRGQPVYPSGNDVISTIPATEAAVSALLGFAMNAASDAAAVSYYTDGLVPLFSGLTAGAEYFVYDMSGPVPFSAVPQGAFYRSVGPAVDSTTILFQRGPVIRKA